MNLALWVLIRGIAGMLAGLFFGDYCAVLPPVGFAYVMLPEAAVSSGYLIESIMNPNALILDGPGYTDARGLSTMPEYRQTMTVGDLIDVVAYLRSLAYQRRSS